MRYFKYFILGFALLLTVTLNIQAQEITNGILSRVFLIKYGKAFGSSFTIEVDGKQYLITARHLVKDIKDGSNIDIMQNHAWHSLKVKVIEVKPDDVDIAVLVLPKQISPAFPIETSLENLAISQDMYFLGFPYGLQMDVKSLNNGFPLPLVKKAICSGVLFDKSGAVIILLDGFNNVGFSGGPVVFTDMKSKLLKIGGVIHGYTRNIDRVVRPGDKSKGEANMVDTGTLALTNSGIVVGYAIEPAIKAIKSNPIGPEVLNKTPVK